ncbi:MAG: hypothetical protein LC798_07500 [Chloroflexi bacterium]|nr:hypothetical protein [Chloroflexota bacterium]
MRGRNNLATVACRAASLPNGWDGRPPSRWLPHEVDYCRVLEDVEGLELGGRAALWR